MIGRLKGLSAMVAASLLLFHTGSLFTDDANTAKGAALFQTTPLERFIYEKYDSKGFSGYTFTIAVEQPIPGSRMAVTEALQTGHAFIRLSKSGRGAWTSYFSYNVETVTTQDVAVGKVDIHKDAVKPFTVAKVFEVREADALRALRYMWEKYRGDRRYNISNNNCITFVLGAAQTAGIDLKQVGIVPRQWMVPDTIRNDGFLNGIMNKNSSGYNGYSAGDAGEDLKSTGNVLFYSDLMKR